MTRSALALPLALLTAGAAGLATAAPASAGDGVAGSFQLTTAASVTSVTMPAAVDAGSTVDGVVTINRSAGGDGPVEVDLAPSTWTRTNACVFVPAGASSATFDVAISRVSSDGQVAYVGAYATPSGADLHSAVSAIVPR